MDVGLRQSEGGASTNHGAEAASFLARGGSRFQRRFGPERVGQLLGEWQAVELRIARSFAECRGLNSAQLEDLYQETATALLNRPHVSEEHLRNALRKGIKHRALNLHRDERRRARIISHHAPGLHLMAETRAAEHGPEHQAQAQQDRLIVSEFLTELTAIERRVFWLLAEGMGYRSIAPALAMGSNEARNACRSCERKRERFQLLYDTGRLCGFRAATIKAMQSGESTSEELAARALAHLESCARCRAEHGTNAKRLRRQFQGHAAAILPFPALSGHFSWIARLGMRARNLQGRTAAAGHLLGQGAVRERAAAILAGSGIGAKVAVGALTIAVVAGGSIGATRLLEQPKVSEHPRAESESTAATPLALHPAALFGITKLSTLVLPGHRARSIASHQRVLTPGHAIAGAPQASQGKGLLHREPGGFAYLGVPSSAGSPSSTPPERGQAAPRSGGGAFSP